MNKRRRLTAMQRVLKLQPTAAYKNMGTVPHHRIFCTVSFSGGGMGSRLIGSGLSPTEAWIDAEQYLKAFRL